VQDRGPPCEEDQRLGNTVCLHLLKVVGKHRPNLDTFLRVVEVESECDEAGDSESLSCTALDPVLVAVDRQNKVRVQERGEIIHDDLSGASGV
jgi:hypothetical protein